MKRFDKGYIYSCMFSDLINAMVIALLVGPDFLIEDEAGEILSVDGEAILWLLGIFLIAYLGCLVYRILYYRTSGYELTENEIKCKRGVLFQKNSVLEYQKVHAINKKQTIFQRLFGVAVLTIDSGSTNTSSVAEIIIIEKAPVVDELLERLRCMGEEAPQKEMPEEMLLTDTDSLYRFTSAKKMLYVGIQMVSALLYTACVCFVLILIISACNLFLRLHILGTWQSYFLYAVILTAVAMLIFTVISLISSVIQSFVGYYDFRITKRGSEIEIAYGLLVRHTNRFGYDRIKGVKISQNLAQRILGFATIKIEVIGYTNGTDENDVAIGTLVPFCKYSEAGEIISRIIPAYTPDKKQTKAVAFFPFISWFSAVYGIVMVAMEITLFWLMHIFGVPGKAMEIILSSVLGVGILVLIFKWISALLSYKTEGVAISEDKITTYSGGFTKLVTVFRVKNLIAVEDVTTPLRRKAGITSLILHLRTNALTNVVNVQIQDVGLVRKLEDKLRC